MQTFNKEQTRFTKGPITNIPIFVLSEVKKLIGYSNFKYKECFEQKGDKIFVTTTKNILIIDVKILEMYPSTTNLDKSVEKCCQKVTNYLQSTISLKQI